MSSQQNYKIIVVGDIGVGKTSILKRYSYGTFNPTSMPTIGFDFQSKSIEKNGKLVKLSLWDVAGSERFQSVTKVFVKEAYGCIIVVSVEEQMEQIVKQIMCKIIYGEMKRGVIYMEWLFYFQSGKILLIKIVMMMGIMNCKSLLCRIKLILFKISKFLRINMMI